MRISCTGDDIFFISVSIFFSTEFGFTFDDYRAYSLSRCCFQPGWSRGTGRGHPGNGEGSWRNGVALSGSGGRSELRINGGTTLSWSMVG